jgi:hypothetical protein
MQPRGARGRRRPRDDAICVSAAVGLSPFGPSLSGTYRRAAALIDRPPCAKPAASPIDQQTTFAFVVDLQAASLPATNDAIEQRRQPIFAWRP